MVQPENAAAQAVAPVQLDPCPAAPPQGYDDFYRTAWRPLIRTLRAYGATREEAEDAAQAALEYMLRGWPIDGHPLAYAKTAALRYFIKARKRGDLRAARRLIQSGHALHREGSEDEQLTAIDSRDWLREVLSQLTPAQREVLTHVANGNSYQEIAEIIGRSPEVVRQRIAAARSRLTKILTPSGFYTQPEATQAPISRKEAR